MNIETDEEIESLLAGVFGKIKEEEKSIAQTFLSDMKNSQMIEKIFKDEKCDIEEYERLITYPHKRLTNGVLKEKGIKTHQAIFIVSNFSFLKAHLETLIVKREGISSSSDKSRRLIKMYYSHFEHGVPLVDSFLPKETLSSENEALAYFEAIYSLYYGQPQKYIDFHK